MQGPPDEAPDGGPSAPDLPDEAPDAVQDLLDGVFGAIGDGEKGVGDVASDLAEKIGEVLGGGGGDEEVFMAAFDAGFWVLDAAVALL